jgi:hypothetical protein
MPRKIAIAGSCMAGLLLSSFASSLGADAPALAAGQRIYKRDAALDVGYYSAPTVTDWNNDGKLDLLVGQLEYGYINLLTNSSSGAIPVFNGSTRLQTEGGYPISIDGWG